MASIDKRPNGRWRARYRDPEGKQHARHFPKKVEAERWLDGVRGDLVRGDYVDPGAGKVTFRDYAEKWRSAQLHRPGTIAQVATHLERHVYPVLGDQPMGEIRRSELQAWVKGRSEVLAPATVIVVWRWVSSIFRAAADDGVVRVSPCRGVKLPKRERAQVVPLETEVVRGLVDAIPERYRAPVFLAATTGMRQGEVFGLTVDRIDFLRRQLRVDRQLITVQGVPPEFGPPKTEASRRTIPLPQVAVDALARHLEQYGVGPDGLVFTNEDGEPIRRTAFSGVWRPAASSVGIPAGTGMHALRHYYASLLIRHGESVKVVQARLGHASAAETLDTYSHLWPDSEDRTRAAIDQALSAEESARVSSPTSTSMRVQPLTAG